VSLSAEIRRVHNELYKLVNGNIKILLPIALTLLQEYKKNCQSGIAEPIAATKTDFERTRKAEIDSTLLRIQTEHPQISPLLRKSIETHLHEIGALPEARINQIIDYISKNKRFLEGLKQEDFIGILYETMVSGEFDKLDGRFFTPKNVISIVTEMLRSLLESQKRDNIADFNVCDPCCGSARYLIYWVKGLKDYLSSQLYSPHGIEEKVSELYAKRLFGVDIHPETAGYACWNMLFHGDGATNIANADSLNHYGILVHWELIQQFIEEFPAKFMETRFHIQQRHIQEKIELVEAKASPVLSIGGKEDVNIGSPEVIDLVEVINILIDIHREVSLNWWPTIEKLHDLKDFDSINEIMKFQWSKINPEVEEGFDLVMTNPPFGRGKNLKINNPYILAQYKLATELWIGEATKDQCLKMIAKLDMPISIKNKSTDKLREEIQRAAGKEWFTIPEVESYAYKVVLRDSLTGDEHPIYYDTNWNPILFKRALPKQILFLEQFLRIVKPGGKVFTVIDTGVLSNNDDEYVRRFLFKNARVHAVVEFPHNAFKAAGTGVKTAVILYEKTSNPPEDYDIFGSLPQHLGYVLNRQDTPPDPDHNDLGMSLCDYRYYLGLDRNCGDPCKKMDSKTLERNGCCSWYRQGYCWVWRDKIEKVEM